MACAFPLTWVADPSLGGMVATNTGGARLLRYGGVRENLMAVEAVLTNPIGARVGSSRALRKNNTGIDWPHLLCGTFGAFGLISQVTVRLHPLPRQRATALVALPSVEAAVEQPVEYYHVVVTLPAPIADIAYQNKAALYGFLFDIAAETLLRIAADPKHLGANIGAMLVLHTWGSFK
jgi:FAD/FMN-containing dehydrogenase